MSKSWKLNETLFEMTKSQVKVNEGHIIKLTGSPSGHLFAKKRNNLAHQRKSINILSFIIFQ